MNFSLFPLSRKSYNILLSLSIITIWTCIILIMSQPAEDKAVEELGLVLLIYYTLFFALSIGFIASAIRIIGFIKDSTNFLYNFTGVLNLCLGLLGIYLVVSNQLGEPWVLLFMFSFVIGVIIMFDVFMNRIVNRES
jgi:hypothetical protein